MKRTPSPNFDDRSPQTAVDMLVLHYTGMKTAEAALERMCDANAKVSAHYLIDEEGELFQLVEEDYRAWHAGESYWRGHRDINARSIGIELVNPGHRFGYLPFTEPQMSRLETLALDIQRRYQVPLGNVVGHADIAPRRKEDPGELFDWHRLYKFGVGLWPDEVTPRSMEELKAIALLQAIGYETESLKKTLIAFQRHFRPRNIDGKLDDETAGMLEALAKFSMFQA